MISLRSNDVWRLTIVSSSRAEVYVNIQDRPDNHGPNKVGRDVNLAAAETIIIESRGDPDPSCSGLICMDGKLWREFSWPVVLGDFGKER